MDLSVGNQSLCCSATLTPCRSAAASLNTQRCAPRCPSRPADCCLGLRAKLSLSLQQVWRRRLLVLLLHGESACSHVTAGGTALNRSSSSRHVSSLAFSSSKPSLERSFHTSHWLEDHSAFPPGHPGLLWPAMALAPSSSSSFHTIILNIDFLHHGQFITNLLILVSHQQNQLFSVIL